MSVNHSLSMKLFITVMLVSLCQAGYPEIEVAMESCFDFFGEPKSVESLEEVFTLYGQLYDHIKGGALGESLKYIAEHNKKGMKERAKNAISITGEGNKVDFSFLKLAKYENDDLAKLLVQFIGIGNLIGFYDVTAEIKVEQIELQTICRSLALMEMAKDVLRSNYTFYFQHPKAIATILYAVLSSNVAFIRPEPDKPLEERIAFYKKCVTANWLFFEAKFNIDGVKQNEAKQMVESESYIITDKNLPNLEEFIPAVSAAIYSQVFTGFIEEELYQKMFKQSFEGLFRSVTGGTFTNKLSYINDLRTDYDSGITAGNGFCSLVEEWDNKIERVLNLVHLMFMGVDGDKNKAGMLPHLFYLMEIEQFETAINPISKRSEGRYRYFSEFYNSEYAQNGFAGLIDYVAYLSRVLSLIEDSLLKDSTYAIKKINEYLGFEENEDSNLYWMSKFCQDFMDKKDYIEDIDCLQEINSKHWYWVKSIEKTNYKKIVKKLGNVLTEAFLAKALAYNKSLIQESNRRILV